MTVTNSLPIFKNEKLLEERLEGIPKTGIIDMAVDSLSRLLCLLNATRTVDTPLHNPNLPSNLDYGIAKCMAETILSLIELQNVFNNYTEIAVIMGEKIQQQYTQYIWGLVRAECFDTDTAKSILNKMYGDTVGKEKKNE